MKLERVVIKVKDYRQSFEFYHDILGLKLKSSWQRDDSWGALFFCGEATMEIIWFPQGEQAAECNYIPEQPKTDLFLAVQDIDMLYKRFTEYENVKLTEPTNAPWGYRIFTITDPDNVKIVFTQPI